MTSKPQREAEVEQPLFLKLTASDDHVPMVRDFDDHVP